MPRFRDIPPLTKSASYKIDVSWQYLEEQLAHYKENHGLVLDPDFQRAHVWTEQQQIRYVEYVLRNGHSSRDLSFNSPGWMGHKICPVTLVDGKQRLQAVRLFLADKIPAFGYCYKEYEDKLPIMECSFRFLINNLPDRASVLRWYIDINAGGIAHTGEEIEKVRQLLEAEKSVKL